MTTDDDASPPPLRWTRLAAIVLGPAVVWFVAHVAVTVGDGLRDDVQITDVAVVLGNKVELDGQPSDRLRARLDRAVELFDDGSIETIIVAVGRAWKASTKPR